MTSVLGSGRASGGPSGQLKCKPKRRRRRRSKRKGKGDLWFFVFFFFALFVCLGACSCRPPRGHAGHCLGMEHTGTPGALPGGTRPEGGRCLRSPLLSAIFIWGRGGLSGCLSPGVPLWRSRKLRRAPRLQAGATPPLFGFFHHFFKIRFAKFCYSGGRSASPSKPLLGKR